MSNSMRDLIVGEAELEDDDEDDASFDEETGEAQERRRPRVEDSSEEDEDEDEDEEEVRKVREGFIDDDDEEEEAEDSGADGRSVPKRKREHRDREEEEQLDEDDLELIGENFGEREPSRPQAKWKRLKHRHGDDDGSGRDRPGLDTMFDEDDEAGDHREYTGTNRYLGEDEFDGFIEDDYPEDEDELQRQQEDAEVARPRDRGIGSVVDTAGLDQDALDDMEEIFGDGEDYAWALRLEDEEEQNEMEEQGIELKDVFEPSQLKEKLLTDEDNEIRFTDEPERFQIANKSFRNLVLTKEETVEEGRWIANLLWHKKGLSPELRLPFVKAIAHVLDFLTKDTLEVPFIFRHRRDFLIHERKSRNPNRDDADQPEYIIKDEKLLNEDDLWRILELDAKFRSFVEKRNALRKTFDNLQSVDVQDEMVEEMMMEAQSMEELQDLQDYLHFQYGPQLRDLAAMSSTGNGSQMKRPGAKSTILERARSGKAAYFVKAYGISADQAARNALRQGRNVAPEDDGQYPMDLADSLVDDNFSTGDEVMKAARQLYADELAASPRMRKHFRQSYYQGAEISCRRTEKGLRKLDESHPLYEVKYLQNQQLRDLLVRPELFLKMVRAEEEGLVEVRIVMPAQYGFRKQLYQALESENFSDRAEQWREERRRVVDTAYPKLEKLVARNIKETTRTFCQDEVLLACRHEYARRLDQAPFKPKGLMIGTTPRVLVVSNGGGPGGPGGGGGAAGGETGPVHYAWVDDDGQIYENGRLGNLARDDAARSTLAEVIERRRPDVLGVSGWSATTARLVRDLEALVRERDLRCPEFEDPDPDVDDYRTDPLEVVVIEDEVARLYKDSPRAKVEHPSLDPVTRYCVALAHYMQDPLKEYAALGNDVISLPFHPSQSLLPPDRLARCLESAMVDLVNMRGVDIHEALSDPYTANLLPFVAGLGPRKATSVVKAINANGGSLTTRAEMVGDPDSGKLPAVGSNVWQNCSSFFRIEYDAANPSSEPLDSTRIHPADYDLARKVAADALDMDEEDVQAEVDEGGLSAVVRRLFKEKQADKVADLDTGEYAEQLLRDWDLRKRTNLVQISSELQGPYEDIRKPFAPPGSSDVFTIFTGETKDSLCEGMIVPVNVRVVKDDFAIVKLDCGVEGRIEAHEVSLPSSSSRNGTASLRDLLSSGQTVRAKIIEINYKDLQAKLSLREDQVKIPFRPASIHGLGHDGWDHALEAADREALRERDQAAGRAQRVVKHPNFKPYNSVQAEEFLGSQPVGEVIIRPSGKGSDHLAVTWKVADNVYQHIDVLEMQKENEFSVGKLLRVGGKYTYSDLDDLFVAHVKAMVRKVDEMTRHDKYLARSRGESEKWLTTYIDANPNRSAYAFCLDTRHPGYFWLCFKASRNAKVLALPVRTIPQGYELMGYQYPDMRALCNGFKLRYQNEFSKMTSR